MQMPRVRALRSAAAILLASAVLAGCGDGTDQQDDLSTACPKIDLASDVPVCTQLFDASTGIRLPAGNAKEPVGALSRGGQFFVDSRGRKWGVAPIQQPSEATDRGYATTVYRAQVADGVATSLKPIMRVTEEAILTHTFGGLVLTGTISARLDDGSYNVRPKLPVVIRLADRAEDGALSGSIVNADRPVRIGDGGCVPVLPGTSDNPLVDGFSSNVRLVRVPSMHLPYGDQMVLEWSESSSGMGHAFYPSVATVMGHDPIGTRWEVVQHGNPMSGPALALRLTDGDIATCEPGGSRQREGQ